MEEIAAFLAVVESRSFTRAARLLRRDASVLTAALAGTGIAMCSDWLAAQDWSAGRLQQLLPDWTIAGAGSVHLIIGYVEPELWILNPEERQVASSLTCPAGGEPG
jgi:DNA-binding transcriptional LysR family regulator